MYCVVHIVNKLPILLFVIAIIITTHTSNGDDDDLRDDGCACVAEMSQYLFKHFSLPP